ncbi:MAG: hypothetical protein WDO56_30150 [Gammaproteobacteria bacterium]
MSVPANEVVRDLSTLTLRNSGAPALRNSESPEVSGSKDSSSEEIPSLPVQQQLSARTTPNNLGWMQAEMKALREPLKVIGAEDTRARIEELSASVDNAVTRCSSPVLEANREEYLQTLPFIAYVEHKTGEKGPDAASRNVTAYPFLSSSFAKDIVEAALNLVTDVSNLAKRELAAPKANESTRAACVKILKICAKVLLGITVTTVLAVGIIAAAVAAAHFLAPTALAVSLIVAAGAVLASAVIVAGAVLIAKPTEEEKKHSALEVLRDSANNLLGPIRDAHDYHLALDLIEKEKTASRNDLVQLSLPSENAEPAYVFLENPSVEDPIDKPHEGSQASNSIRAEYGDI